MKKAIKYIVPIIIFIVGLSVMLYPTFSNAVNQHRQNRLISEYVEEVEAMQEDKIADLKARADEYNRALKSSFHDAFTSGQTQRDEQYWSLLNLDGNGIMGYLEIPKINVRLAIYHEDGLEIPENGVGHLKGTSLPVGGENTHCVLSGHRGLPSARLFTDLDKVDIGDYFTLYVLGEKLTYQVDQILIVEPDEVDSLKNSAGMDYVTLVTCTPYGVNSHRLLVRGFRTQTAPETQSELPTPAISGINLFVVIPILAAVILLLLAVVIKMTYKKK